MLRLSLTASAQRSDDGTAATGALQFPAPPATASAAEGHADEAGDEHRASGGSASS